MSSGIIICAGGKEMLFNALLVINLIRKFHKCSLPITLFYANQTELDPAKRVLKYFHELGVQTVNASKLNERLPVQYQYKKLGGWQIKPFCLFHSPYRYTLMLDSESYPVKNPDELISALKQSQSRMILWPDRANFRSDPAIKKYKYNRLKGKGFKFVDKPVESGQLLIDTVFHKRTLLACLILNREYEQIYRWVYGDKDTYAWAAEIVNMPYTVIETKPHYGVKRQLTFEVPIAMIQYWKSQKDIATVHFSLDPDPKFKQPLTPSSAVPIRSNVIPAAHVLFIGTQKLNLDEIFTFIRSQHQECSKAVKDVPRLRKLHASYHLALI